MMGSLMMFGGVIILGCAVGSIYTQSIGCLVIGGGLIVCGMIKVVARS